jgi:hypothetical protein
VQDERLQWAAQLLKCTASALGTVKVVGPKLTAIGIYLRRPPQECAQRLRYLAQIDAKRAKKMATKMQRAAARSSASGKLPATSDNMAQLADGDSILASLQPEPGRTEVSSSNVAAGVRDSVRNMPETPPRVTLTPGDLAGDNTMPASPAYGAEPLPTSQAMAGGITLVDTPCVVAAGLIAAGSALVLPSEATSCIEGGDSATVEPANTAEHATVATASPTASPIPPATSTLDGPTILPKVTEKVVFDEQFWGSPPPVGDHPAWDAVAHLAYHDSESLGFIPEDVLPEACWAVSTRPEGCSLPFYSLNVEALEHAYKIKTGQYELPDAAELVSGATEALIFVVCPYNLAISTTGR